MLNHKISLRSFYKDLIITSLLCNFLYSQNENAKPDSSQTDISISSRIGIGITDYVDKEFPINSRFIGIDINVPLKVGYLRFQYCHHFLGRDTRIIMDSHPDGGENFRSELIASLFQKTNYKKIIVGFSFGFGFGYLKESYQDGLYPIIPFTFNIGLELNRKFNLSLEIREDLRYKPTCYLGFLFEIKPNYF